MRTIRPFGSESAAFRRIPETLGDSELRVNVLFTDDEGTRTALKQAVDLASGLDAATRIIVPYIVPFPLPLNDPPVPLNFTCERIQCLAGSVGADPYVDLYLCRDRVDLLQKILPPESIIVIGARKRWFPTRAERIARRLRKQGCDVLLARYE